MLKTNKIIKLQNIIIWSPFSSVKWGGIRSLINGPTLTTYITARNKSYQQKIKWRQRVWSSVPTLGKNYFLHIMAVLGFAWVILVLVVDLYFKTFFWKESFARLIYVLKNAYSMYYICFFWEEKFVVNSLTNKILKLQKYYHPLLMFLS